MSAGLDDVTAGRELVVMVRDRGEQLQPLSGLKRSHEDDVHTVYLRDHKRQRLECVEVLEEEREEESHVQDPHHYSREGKRPAF